MVLAAEANQAMNKLAKQSRDDGKTKSLLLDSEIFNVPSMALMKDCFLLCTQQPSHPSQERQAAIQKLMTVIVEKSTNYYILIQFCKLRYYCIEMAPFYLYLTQQSYFEWSLDRSIYDQWEAEHAVKLKEFEEKLEDAKQNLGASDVFEILTEKALYLGKILDQASPLTTVVYV
jgi:protein associated with RNAse G/E